MSGDASAVGPLRCRDGEPLFQEPWQAKSLAIAARLVEAGYFSPSDWSEALGAEIRKAARDDAPDDQESYYAAVLRALEQLLEARDLIAGADISDRKAAWVCAYERTPHGRPVILEASE